jgi:serine/threonine-protein kinase
MTATPSPVDDAERFGRYVILRPIRKGGMAQLALAFDTVESVPVVLKRLPPNSAARREQFLDEIALSQSIASHPNLVPTLNSGQIDGRDFLAVEWIDGPDLERLLEVAVGGKLDLPIPVAVASSIAIQVLRGLAHLHASGCIHRDVGAPNIMVGYDGIPRLIDYGIAKFEGKKHRTVVGDIVGTQGFIAPELDGHESATERSDLYGVGASLWFLLTGLRFYDRGVDNNGKDLLALQLKERGRDNVPAGLLTFLWRSLHRTPSVRYESADEAAQALQQSCPPASQAIVADFVGHLFAGEKQLSAEHVAEWRRKYVPKRVQPTAVIQRVDPSAADRDAKRSKLLFAVGCIAAVSIIASAATLVSRHHRKPAETVAQQPLASPLVPTALPSRAAELAAPEPPAVTSTAPPSVTVKMERPASPAPLSAATIRKRMAEARDLAGMGRTNVAREIYAALEQDTQARPQALVGLAKLAYGDGDYAGAVRLATTAAKAGAGPDALMVRASAYLARREADRAEADFERVLALQPRNADAAEGRKMAARLKGTTP